MVPPQKMVPPEHALIAELATGVWRLLHRLEPEEEAASPVLRRVRRDVESLWDRLQQAGVDVLDHTGQAYHPGDSVKVIAFQPVVGNQAERVIETLRPTVYYRGQWIQMGEVIVANPAPGASGSERRDQERAEGHHDANHH
jgi:hypothetical protein